MKTYEKIEFKNRMSEKSKKRFAECDKLTKAFFSFSQTTFELFSLLAIFLAIAFLAAFIAKHPLTILLLILTAVFAIIVFGRLNEKFYLKVLKRENPVEEHGKLQKIHEAETAIEKIEKLKEEFEREKECFEDRMAEYTVTEDEILYTAKYADSDGNVVTKQVSLTVNEIIENIKITVPIYDLETQILLVPAK